MEVDQNLKRLMKKSTYQIKITKMHFLFLKYLKVMTLFLCKNYIKGNKVTLINFMFFSPYAIMKNIKSKIGKRNQFDEPKIQTNKNPILSYWILYLFV